MRGQSAQYESYDHRLFLSPFRQGGTEVIENWNAPGILLNNGLPSSMFARLVRRRWRALSILLSSRLATGNN